MASETTLQDHNEVYRFVTDTRWQLIVGLVAVVLLALVPFVIPGEFWPGFILGLMVFMILAIGFNIIAGYAGQFSLGHVFFYGIGGYIGAVSVVKFGLSWQVGLILAGIGAILVAIPVGYITLRLHGIFFAFGTLAVAEMARIGFLSWGYVGAAAGIPFPPNFPFDLTVFYLITLSLLVLSVLLNVFHDRSQYGVKLQALRDDETKAKAIGINTWLYKNVAFVLSGILPAMAGAVQTYFFLFIDPRGAFNPLISITMQLMVVLGGIGTIAGPLLGGSVFYGVREVASFTFPQLHFLVTGLLMIVLIIYMPEGVAGWVMDQLEDW